VAGVSQVGAIANRIFSATQPMDSTAMNHYGIAQGGEEPAQ